MFSTQCPCLHRNPSSWLQFLPAVRPPVVPYRPFLLLAPPALLAVESGWFFPVLALVWPVENGIIPSLCSFICTQCSCHKGGKCLFSHSPLLGSRRSSETAEWVLCLKGYTVFLKKCISMVFPFLGFICSRRFKSCSKSGLEAWEVALPAFRYQKASSSACWAGAAWQPPLGHAWVPCAAPDEVSLLSCGVEMLQPLFK